MSEIPEKHKAHAPKSLNAYVITLSTSKFQDKKQGRLFTDESGDIIIELLQGAGHHIIRRSLISDNPRMLARELKRGLSMKNADCIITTGGTGVAPTDITVQLARRFIQKELPGFGELFRSISYQKIGSAAMMSGAVAGVTRSKCIFCLPGSPNAVRDAMTSLILPEMGHIIKLARGP